MFGLFKRKKKPEAKQEPKLRLYQREAVDLLKHRDAAIRPPRRSPPAVQTRREDDSDNFALSMAVGMATDSALLGYAAGGSLAGGMVGASLSESTSRSESISSPSDTSSSCDTGSSYDTGSSFNSGSCGGSDSGSW
ncbi:hypothetical protein OJF2_51460 [Aquisphaera giovannonii]|uniref:Uncharacterized protein n=1 Tax=Aquisphaera giovannonii TaxID=406548 RepID=A0A5B9W7A6_9BACT|nr:hypothetical protein [Aquisphaera giovannonii]QEH36562.1 hypothetical protein OJF2_51460 [Aquisphaera giovannonii]